MTLLIRRAVLAVVLCFNILLWPLYGQQKVPQAWPANYTDLVRKEYGLDQDLVNGIQYYNRNVRSKGDPYFLTNRFQRGSITIKGEIHYNVSLRFDIHSQNVEIEYENFSGGSNQAITIFDHVDAFIMGEYQFRKMNIDEKDEKFYQVITTGCFKVYVFWEKGLIPVSGSTTHTDQFADAKHTFWLDLNGVVTQFNSRKDFSECFSEEQKKEIKRLLSRNQFQFRTAQVGEVIRNMESVCNLLEGDI